MFTVCNDGPRPSWDMKGQSERKSARTTRKSGYIHVKKKRSVYYSNSSDSDESDCKEALTDWNQRYTGKHSMPDPNKQHKVWKALRTQITGRALANCWQRALAYEVICLNSSQYSRELHNQICSQTLLPKYKRRLADSEWDIEALCNDEGFVSLKKVDKTEFLKSAAVCLNSILLYLMIRSHICHCNVTVVH
ncbi:MAG: hypothetical protein GY941_15080 [Planctomycetes bacterium]|nr:hypothetical protein [Planctomycetota bacterium]